MNVDYAGAMMTACARNDGDTVRELLARGADPNASEPAASKRSVRALHVAAAAGYANIVALLLGAGADANVRHSDGGVTATHLAAANGDTGVVEMLLSHGADPLAVRTDGATAVAAATEGGHFDLAKLLLERCVEARRGLPHRSSPLRAAKAASPPRAEAAAARPASSKRLSPPPPSHEILAALQRVGSSAERKRQYARGWDALVVQQDALTLAAATRARSLAATRFKCRRALTQTRVAFVGWRTVYIAGMHDRLVRELAAEREEAKHARRSAQAAFEKERASLLERLEVEHRAHVAKAKQAHQFRAHLAESVRMRTHIRTKAETFHAWRGAWRDAREARSVLLSRQHRAAAAASTSAEEHARTFSNPQKSFELIFGRATSASTSADEGGAEGGLGGGLAAAVVRRRERRRERLRDRFERSAARSDEERRSLIGGAESAGAAAATQLSSSGGGGSNSACARDGGVGPSPESTDSSFADFNLGGSGGMQQAGGGEAEDQESAMPLVTDELLAPVDARELDAEDARGRERVETTESALGGGGASRDLEVNARAVVGSVEPAAAEKPEESAGGRDRVESFQPPSAEESTCSSSSSDRSDVGWDGRGRAESLPAPPPGESEEEEGYSDAYGDT